MTTPRTGRRWWAAGWLGAIVVWLVVIQSAWVCDDAFITLRVADHALAGRGLVYNEGWRVQAFTHPAWLLVLAPIYGIVGSGFWAAIVAGVGTTAAALWVGLVRIARGPTTLLLAVALLGSRAFIDYSTAGLENPLVHLVVGLAAWAYLGRAHRGRAFARIAGLGGLAFLCRPDAPLLLLPLALAAARQALARGTGWRALGRAAALGLLPVVAWEGLSLVYYGALVPNTALAKLGAELPRLEVWARGGRYLLDTAIADRVTAVAVLGGAMWCWTHRRTRPFAQGALLYLAYVVWIGGDFMAGRFLTAPLWLVALGVARRPIRPRVAALAGAGLLVMGLLSARPPLLTGPGSPRAEPPPPRWGIADERAHYAAAASLWAWSPDRSLPAHPWRERGEAAPEGGARVVQFDTLGYYGFFADPHVHVVDRFALADPLLARLPAIRRLDWRPGHLARPIPRGYLEALEDGDPSHLRDPAVAELFEALQRVHRGPLWAPERWAAIWALHTGALPAGLDRARYRFFDAIHVQAQRVLPHDRPLRIRDTGLRVEGLTPGLGLVLTVEPPVAVELRWLATDEPIHTVVQPAAERFTTRVPAGADGLHLIPQAMGGARSLRVGIGPAEPAPPERPSP